jgi:hypothetical protein
MAQLYLMQPNLMQPNLMQPDLMQPNLMQHLVQHLVQPRRIALAAGLFLLGSALAQEPRNLFEKAPPDVDQALRARIEKFYQFFVTGKFRLAEPLVAEDSKDVFFAAEKKKYKDCELGSIAYADNFKKAKAVVSCDTEYFGFGRQIPIKLPITSLWKVQDGEWFWYVIPASQLTEYNTPFGPAKRPPEESGDAPPAPAPAVSPRVSPEQVMKAVRVDRDSLDFNTAKSSNQEVHIKNTMPGSVTLTASTGIKGLSVKPAKAELQPGEDLTVVIAFDPLDPAIGCPTCLSHPQDRQAGEVTLRVAPTGQVIPIQVRFVVPAPAAK